MLPRTPLEGGVVEIKLKRKKEYKSSYRQEYIDPQKLFRAIKFLKDSENPFYQNISDIDTYSEHCEFQDSDMIFEHESGSKLFKSIKR